MKSTQPSMNNKARTLQRSGLLYFRVSKSLAPLFAQANAAGASTSILRRLSQISAN
jgi:hypothetical protein